MAAMTVRVRLHLRRAPPRPRPPQSVASCAAEAGKLLPVPGLPHSSLLFRRSPSRRDVSPAVKSTGVDRKLQLSFVGKRERARSTRFAVRVAEQARFWQDRPPSSDF